MIDFECSGILEIMAFLALLAFFDVFSVYERILVGVIGICYIILANAFRIFVICTVIYFNGISAYSFAHTIVGRIIFYGMSVILYFVVFTKGQIGRQKVGGFTYGVNKQTFEFVSVLGRVDYYSMHYGNNPGHRKLSYIAQKAEEKEKNRNKILSGDYNNDAGL